MRPLADLMTEAVTGQRAAAPGSADSNGEATSAGGDAGAGAPRDEPSGSGRGQLEHEPPSVDQTAAEASELVAALNREAAVLRRERGRGARARGSDIAQAQVPTSFPAPIWFPSCCFRSCDLMHFYRTFPLLAALLCFYFSCVVAGCRSQLCWQPSMHRRLLLATRVDAPARMMLLRLRSTSYPRA